LIADGRLKRIRCSCPQCSKRHKQQEGKS
jgi:hypothetical protein